MALTDMVIMPGADYQDIVDATREKTGSTDLLKSGEVGAAIRSISGGSVASETVLAHFLNDGESPISYTFMLTLGGEYEKGTTTIDNGSESFHEFDKGTVLFVEFTDGNATHVKGCDDAGEIDESVAIDCIRSYDNMLMAVAGTHNIAVTLSSGGGA